jgi:hypothetical protein
MKVKYHQKELDFSCRYANQPLELPARLDAVKEALDKSLQSASVSAVWPLSTEAREA